MAQITLPERLVDRLQDAAAKEGIDVSKLLERAAEQYLVQATNSAKDFNGDEQEVSREDHERIIDEEQKAYEAQHEEIYKKYAGQYIAMRRGTLLDHDQDRLALLDRVRARFGQEPVLITPVLAEPVQEIFVRDYRSQRPKP